MPRTAAGVGASKAILFKLTTGTLADTTFLTVRANNVASYQADQDFVFQLDNNPAVIVAVESI